MNPLALSLMALTATQIFYPGQAWRDTDNNLIQAHGGGIFQDNGTYYWYGENKSKGYNNKTGVSCYSSHDLLTWKNEGVVLPKSAFPILFQDEGVCERPKVIYNPHTKQFVMWMHVDANGYRVSEAGVAIAEKATGPFRWIRSFRPRAESTYRDMNLFADDDGRAYTIYSGENNQTMHVVRLNREFTGVEADLEEGINWARIFVGESREAPAPFKYQGKYYLITSACTGWAANEGQVAIADHILGPWRILGSPFMDDRAKTSFNSQSTFILPVPGRPGAFIYMGDRWNEKDLSNSRYVWLPLIVTGDKVEIRNHVQWDLSIFDDTESQQS